MKQILVKALKISLILLAVFLAALLVFGLVLAFDWPWWVGIFLLFGLCGIWIGVVYVKKLLQRKREQQFVHQVIQQDDAYLQSLGKKEQDNSRMLQDRWKEAVDALRKSHLRKLGNPLYVLPWYMVIGESGSGKTTAIESARLSSPFAEVNRTSGISGTRNCDWWFFEQAILLDTAGRYAIPVDEGRDKDEWQKFLSILVKYRKKEPLNGLVVTVAADKLLHSTEKELDASGASIRQRVDELMRVLGAKFPVYVMVTKMDLVQGMTQLSDGMEEGRLNQALGVLNHDLDKDYLSFCRRSMDTIVDRLKDLRLILLHRKGRPSDENDASTVIFPEEFGKLKRGLAAFFKGAFQENPYQEAPILRGIFFSSGRQEGTPYSQFLSALGLMDKKEVLPGTSKGLFLHDFFSKILPADRKLFAPTQRSLEWSRLTKNLGLTAWVAIVIALCGLISFSFVKNLKALRDVSHQISDTPVQQGQVVEDLISLERYQQAVYQVEEKNRTWWFPRFGLNETEEVEADLKQKFCEQYQQGFLKGFDQRMADIMARFSSATPPETIALHVVHMVRRINLLKKRMEKSQMDGSDWEEMSSLPQPQYRMSLIGESRELIPEIRNKVSNLYRYYLFWGQDKAYLGDELKHLQTWLKHLLTLEGTDLNWLTLWANADEELSPVALGDFWGQFEKEEAAAILVAPAFTIEGKQKIDAFLQEMDNALFDPLIVAEKKLDFTKGYTTGYLQAWHDFAAAFPKAPEWMDGKKQWQQAVPRMGTESDPFWTLIDQMTIELEPFSQQETKPKWVAWLYDFSAIKNEAAAQGAAPGKKPIQPGILKKATKKVKSTLKKVEKATGVKAKSLMSPEAQLTAVTTFTEYQMAISEITPVAGSTNLAYQMATALYAEDPATSESPFHRAETARKKLFGALTPSGHELKVMEQLTTGPIVFLQAYVSRESACYLQNKWEQDVMVEIQDVSDQVDRNKLMMGEGGFAKKFIEGSAAPFISRSRKKGYYAKKVNGMNVPLGDDFFAYLTKGARAAQPIKGSYNVRIKAYPTSANKGARVIPHRTRLSLQCADATHTLVNENYPIGKTFKWSPESCGDVTFKIEVGNLILEKIYSGYRAFPNFLNHFKDGQHRFTAKSFPSEYPALKRMGIDTITIKYRLSGHEPVLKILRLAPGRPPNTIAACWE